MLLSQVETQGTGSLHCLHVGSTVFSDFLRDDSRLALQWCSKEMSAASGSLKLPAIHYEVKQPLDALFLGSLC